MGAKALETVVSGAKIGLVALGGVSLPVMAYHQMTDPALFAAQVFAQTDVPAMVVGDTLYVSPTVIEGVNTLAGQLEQKLGDVEGHRNPGFLLYFMLHNGYGPDPGTGQPGNYVVVPDVQWAERLGYDPAVSRQLANMFNTYQDIAKALFELAYINNQGDDDGSRWMSPEEKGQRIRLLAGALQVLNPTRPAATLHSGERIYWTGNSTDLTPEQAAELRYVSEAVAPVMGLLSVGAEVTDPTGEYRRSFFEAYEDVTRAQNDLLKELRGMEAANKRLGDRANGLEAELERFKGMNEAERQQLADDYGTSVDSLTSVYQQRLGGIFASMDSLKAASDSMAASFQEDVADYEASLERYRNANLALMFRVQELGGVLDGMRANNENLQALVGENGTTINLLNDWIRAYEGSQVGLEASLAARAAELDSLQARYAALASERDSLGLHASELDSLFGASQDSLRMAQTDLAASRALVDRLTGLIRLELVDGIGIGAGRAHGDPGVYVEVTGRAFTGTRLLPDAFGLRAGFYSSPGDSTIIDPVTQQLDEYVFGQSWTARYRDISYRDIVAVLQWGTRHGSIGLAVGLTDRALEAYDNVTERLYLKTPDGEEIDFGQNPGTTERDPVATHKTRGFVELTAELRVTNHFGLTVSGNQNRQFAGLKWHPAGKKVPKQK
ncbi:MAG: hypothetical protein ABH879_02540 [archaeon]